MQPTVTSASPLLDVTVDLMRHDMPSYKITFRNRAARAVMAVSFKMYRGEKEVGSGRRKTNRSTPIVDAAGDYTFTLQVGGGETPGFDRFGVDGVLWDDGRVEGNPELKATERALTVGHAQQLRGVLAILRTAAPSNDSTAEPASLGQIRAAIEALPIRPTPPTRPLLPKEFRDTSIRSRSESSRSRMPSCRTSMPTCGHMLEALDHQPPLGLRRPGRGTRPG